MNPRDWFNDNYKETNNSSTNLIVNEILDLYSFILQSFLGTSTKNLKNFKEALKTRKTYIGFKNWFETEGLEFLTNLSKVSLEENKQLEEELEYVKFILKSESKNVFEYPSDTIGTLCDISDQIKSLINNVSERIE